MTGLMFMYVSCCVQESTDFVFQGKEIWINPELSMLKLLYQGLLGYLCFTALIMILTATNSNYRNTPFMTSIKFQILTGLVK